MTATAKGFLERIKDGETVLVGEGYMMEFERRCYLEAGAFIPEVVLEHPHLVQNMYEEFAHAGSDVIMTFTYFANRTKLRSIGREDDLEKMNRSALRMAREVADKTGTLVAGSVCNTNHYNPNIKESHEVVEQIYKEQIEWAVEEGADLIVGQTLSYLGEAKLALKCIKKYGKGLPAVITMVPHRDELTSEDTETPIEQALRQLELEGADVVGLNCYRGPDSMIPVIKKVRAACKGPIACMPLPYRTTPEKPTLHDLRDLRTGRRAFPLDMDQWLDSRSRFAALAQELRELNVQYMGLCCGNRPCYTRAMAESLGRKPRGSKYSPDMTKHITENTDEIFQHYKDRLIKLYGFDAKE